MAWLDTKTGKDNCPCCNRILSGASSDEGFVPIPGDITICGYCAELLIFESDMALREFTKIEFDLLQDEELKKKLLFYQSKIKELK